MHNNQQQLNAESPLSNAERLNLYCQRREIYLRHLGEGIKVSFPIKIVRVH